MPEPNDRNVIPVEIPAATRSYKRVEMTSRPSVTPPHPLHAYLPLFPHLVLLFLSLSVCLSVCLRVGGVLSLDAVDSARLHALITDDAIVPGDVISQ